MKNKKLIAIVGPTGIGKTSLAIEVARYFQTEIVSADSRQFYHEVKIGVARPSASELASVPHHLVASHSIHEPLSAGSFATLAQNIIDEIFLTNDYAVLVGGSGLYVDALINGIDDLPSDSAIKQNLEKQLEQHGIESLQESLKSIDPEYYSKVDIHNPHRLIRALEVAAITGQTYTSLRTGKQAEKEYDILKIGITAERSFIYNRINIRVDQMIKEGLLEEVKSLISYKDLIALNTVGYKELFDFFQGNCSLEHSIDKIKQHTRNYAKRQLTWWNRQADVYWLKADGEYPPINQFIEMYSTKN